MQLNKLFPFHAGLLRGLAFCAALAAVSGCSSDDANEKASNSDAALLKVMGVEDRKTAQTSNGAGQEEKLDMRIIEPDFDRGMGQPEIKVEKREGSALDF